MEPQIINPIKVRVIDPQNDPAKNFVTYLVMGNDELGTFEIRRRFNDFFYLRECLRKRWPGLYIPPIPEKKINFSKDDQQIEYRRKFFEHFLKQLSTYHHLFYCSITQEFLRTKTTEMEKYYQTVPHPKTSDLTKEYKDLFPNIKTADQNQLKNVCTNFFVYLKKADKQIKSMSSQMVAIAEARQAFLQNLNNCNSTILPQYEKNVYAEYFQGSSRQPMLLFLQDHKVQDNIRNLRDNSVNKPNSFGILCDSLIFEGREIEAFQETILSKQNIETTKKKLQEKCLASQAQISKLMGGKFSFKSIFTKGDKNQQIQVLEKEIPEMQKQIQNMNELCNITNAIVAEIEIPKFKHTKKHQYYQNLANTSQSELEFLGAYGDLMKSVMDGLNRNIIKT